MKIYIYLVLFLSFAFTACVSPEKYQALEDENRATQFRLAEAEKRVAELEGKLGIVSNEKTQLSKEKNELSHSNEEMKQALEELEKRKLEAEKRLADYRELTQKFSALVDAGKIKIKFIHGKMD